MNLRYLFILVFLIVSRLGFAQTKEDSLVLRNDSILVSKGVDSLRRAIQDTVSKKKHSPRKAAIRSAILPGWGQVYNRKIWKVPIVYGALGTSAGVFIFNIRQYKDIQLAYTILVNKQTWRYPEVALELQPFLANNETTSLFNARSEVRQNVDYSALIFLALWGLNVVDALVDGHLKEFDVSPDLSLKVKPTYNSTFSNLGVSLVFDIHKPKPRTLRPMGAGF